MANILETIAATKRREVEALKRLIPADDLRLRATGVFRPVNSMKHSISVRKIAVIAEHKRRSPSKGEINPMSEVGEVAEAYACNGAAAMSVLTDTPYFGGSLDDLATARGVAPWLPILRKEFIVDEYQLLQARIYGADAVLLIASMLDGETLRTLNDKAHLLGLETLVELHSEDELRKLPPDADMAGINNRDLTSFKTDISNCARLVDMLPDGIVKVAESGMKKPEDIVRLKRAGFDAFLIGEALMGTADPGETLRHFIHAAEEEYSAGES